MVQLMTFSFPPPTGLEGFRLSSINGYIAKLSMGLDGRWRSPRIQRGRQTTSLRTTSECMRLRSYIPDLIKGIFSIFNSIE